MIQINPDHGVCYIPYGGEEIAKENYQVLMTRHLSSLSFYLQVLVIDKMRLKH